MAAPTYVSAESLKATLSLTGFSFADEDVDLAVAAASRAIDAATFRRFWQDEYATEQRIYRPYNPALLEIDDAVEVAEVAVDAGRDGSFTEVWQEGIDFQLEPLNAAADGRPFERLRVLEPRGAFAWWGRLALNVRLTGQFGWPEVPPEVEQATAIVAHRLLRRAREAPFGIVTLGLDQPTALRIARQDPDLLTLLDGVTRQLVLA